MSPAAAPMLLGLAFAAITAFLESRHARASRPPPEPPGLALMRAFYAAQQSQDLAGLEELLDEDFQLVLTGGPYANGAMDRAEAVEFLRGLWSSSAGSYRVEPRELFADASGGAALVVERALRRELGLSLEEDAVHLFRFRGRRLLELKTLSPKPDSFAAFWRQDAGAPLRHPRRAVVDLE